jgi:hypothetical protein
MDVIYTTCLHVKYVCNMAPGMKFFSTLCTQRKGFHLCRKFKEIKIAVFVVRRLSHFYSNPFKRGQFLYLDVKVLMIF